MVTGVRSVAISLVTYNLKRRCKLEEKIASNQQSAGLREMLAVESLCYINREEPTLETLDYTIRIGNTPIFLHIQQSIN